MKKSILSAVLLASLSASAFAADPLVQTATWSGVVPAITSNGEIIVTDTTAGGMANGEIVFERAVDGSLSLASATSVRFDVKSAVDNLDTDYDLTLTNVAATADGTGMAAAWAVKNAGVELVAGTAATSLLGSADITIEPSAAALTELESQPDAAVSVVATLSVAASASAI